MPQRHFVKYTFLRIDPAWRRLDADVREAGKAEFAAACADFADGHLLQAFSTVGTRGDTDLMLLPTYENLDRIHEFHVVLGQSGLMRWVIIPPFVLGDDEAVGVLRRITPRSSPRTREVPLRLSLREDARVVRAPIPKERWRIMQEHIALGREYPDIDLNTSYSFGLDDQEFVVAFETNDPGSFLDLVQRLRTTESSLYTKRDTPTFTCISTSVERALSALDGDALAAELA